MIQIDIGFGGGIMRLAFVFSIAGAVAGPAWADTWNASTQLTAQSPSSCPAASFTYELSLNGNQFSGKSPAGAAFSSNVSPDGTVRVQHSSGPKVGTVTIGGNAVARQLELSASALPQCRYALVPSAGAAPRPIATSEGSGEWAVGRWDGYLTKLGGAGGGAGSSSLQTEQRAMIIARTPAGLTCRWSFPESVEGDYAKSCKIRDSSISLVTSAGTDVELTRSAENSLSGTFVNKGNINNYGSTRLSMTRAHR
jgi:hypothetical protein